MTSLNPQINALFQAYCSTMAIELALGHASERWLLDAHHAGLTPDDFKLAIKARLKFNGQGGFQRGVMLHHFVRGDEEIAVTLNEAAVVRATMRIKVMPEAKASVLRATGRPDTVPQSDAKVVGDLLNELKRAAK